MWCSVLLTTICMFTFCVCQFLELDYFQKLDLISPDTFLLAVDDPRPNIGSGSAVLNALLCVSEHLAAHSGYSVCI